MVVQGIIFDLYGTLVEMTEKLWPYRQFFQAVRMTAYEVGVARCRALTEDFLTFRDYVQQIKPEHIGDLSLYEQGIHKECASVVLFPETKYVLAELRRKGKKIGVISNVGSLHIEPFFRLGLDQFVDYYMFSCKVGVQKPQIEIYTQILNLMALSPSECLMVGDTLEDDVVGPNRVGVRAYLLDRDGKKETTGVPTISSLNALLSVV